MWQCMLWAVGSWLPLPDAGSVAWLLPVKREVFLPTDTKCCLIEGGLINRVLLYYCRVLTLQEP